MGVTETTRRESYDVLDTATTYKHIVSILESGASMTAREISVAMYGKRYIPYPVRQAVAPRLTELADEGIVEVAGKKYDDVTKRNVAVYKLVER